MLLVQDGRRVTPGTKLLVGQFNPMPTKNSGINRRAVFFCGTSRNVDGSLHLALSLEYMRRGEKANILLPIFFSVQKDAPSIDLQLTFDNEPEEVLRISVTEFNLPGNSVIIANSQPEHV